MINTGDYIEFKLSRNKCKIIYVGDCIKIIYDNSRVVISLEEFKYIWETGQINIIKLMEPNKYIKKLDII